MLSLKRLFCSHTNTRTLTNFHGDYINIASGPFRITRRLIVCDDCGAIIKKSDVDPNCNVINWITRNSI